MYSNILSTYCTICMIDRECFAGMLAKSPSERFSIDQVRRHDWCQKHHPRPFEPGSLVSSPADDQDNHEEARVPLPTLCGDPLRSMTVMPYLEQLYGDGDAEAAGPLVLTGRELDGALCLIHKTFLLRTLQVVRLELLGADVHGGSGGMLLLRYPNPQPGAS